MRSSIYLIPICTVLCSLPSTATTINFSSIIVPGSAVIESANGNIPGSTPVGGTPAVLALSFSPAVAGETITIGSITGEIGCCNGVDTFPDGGTESAINISSYGSISGFVGPYSVPLTGVFTTSAPPSGSAPATLTYTAAGMEDTTYSPLLNQVFFIGDGYTGNDIGTANQTGTQQVFDVPVGATQLFLGVPDACSFNGTPGCYSDNPGSFTVSGQLNNVPGTGTAPEPATLGLISLGLAAMGFRRMRV